MTAGQMRDRASHSSLQEVVHGAQVSPREMGTVLLKLPPSVQENALSNGRMIAEQARANKPHAVPLGSRCNARRALGTWFRDGLRVAPTSQASQEGVDLRHPFRGRGQGFAGARVETSEFGEDRAANPVARLAEIPESLYRPPSSMAAPTHQGASR